MSTPKTPAATRGRAALKPLTIPPSPFLESLGYGTGVNVWKLHRSKVQQNTVGSPWAIKNIRKNMCKSLSQTYENLISKEADILKTLNHKNIIGFRGYMTAEDGRKCLAMELGGDSLGNMIETRYESKLGPFPAKPILRVAECVADALEYLHDEKNILHGDIKSYNIVIKNDFEIVKLCDFGVSVNMDENGIAKGFVGTPIYSAPECQDGAKGPITCKADIFSLGLVIWEMIALVPPHMEIEDLDDEDLDESIASSERDSDMDNSSLCLNESGLAEKFGTRPNLPDVELGAEYSSIIEVFYTCTEHDPDKRPTARGLAKHLQQLTT